MSMISATHATHATHTTHTTHTTNTTNTTTTTRWLLMGLLLCIFVQTIWFNSRVHVALSNATKMTPTGATMTTTTTTTGNIGAIQSSSFFLSSISSNCSTGTSSTASASATTTATKRKNETTTVTTTTTTTTNPSSNTSISFSSSSRSRTGTDERTALRDNLLFQYRSLPEPRDEASSSSSSSSFSNTQQEITYWLRRRQSVGVNNIVLVVHGSVSKIRIRLSDLQSRWGGPISCAVYLPSEDDIRDFWDYLQEQSRTPSPQEQEEEESSWSSLALESTTFHLLLERRSSSLSTYPINQLRNLAQRNIESDFLFLLDMDFVPSAGAYKHLVRHVAAGTNSVDSALAASAPSSSTFVEKMRRKTLFVLPAFERFFDDDIVVTTTTSSAAAASAASSDHDDNNNDVIGLMLPPGSDKNHDRDADDSDPDHDVAVWDVPIRKIPETKRALEYLWKKKKVDVFHSYFFPGHTPTNYTVWRDGGRTDFGDDNDGGAGGGGDDFSYPVRYKKRYEPYVVAYKYGLPDFWPGFRGFGYNAGGWHWELHLLGFRYEVLRRHFCVHRNHGTKGGDDREKRVVAPEQETEIQRFFKYLLGRYGLNRKDIFYWRKYLREY